MKRRSAFLILALGLVLGLCACGGGGTATPGAADVKLAGGTWTETLEYPFNVDDYTASDEIRAIPEDWTLPGDLSIDEKTRTEVCGERLLYGPFDGSTLNGFTVVNYTGEGQVEEVYQFTDGVTVTWQQFFNVDGTRIAFPWKAAPESEAWSLRVVDLASGKAEDLDLPEGAGDRDLLLCAWNNDLIVTAVNMDYDDGENAPLTWVYAFPEAE